MLSRNLGLLACIRTHVHMSAMFPIVWAYLQFSHRVRMWWESHIVPSYNDRTNRNVIRTYPRTQKIKLAKVSSRFLCWFKILARSRQLRRWRSAQCYRIWELRDFRPRARVNVIPMVNGNSPEQKLGTLVTFWIESMWYRERIPIVVLVGFHIHSICVSIMNLPCARAH